MKLIDLVKDQSVEFDFFRDKTFYYICTDGVDKYRFSVPIDEIGEGCMLSTDKAIYFMRFIRKAFESDTLQKI